MPRVPPTATARARNLRRSATPAERRLWQRLAPYRPRFTRQLPVGRYIIDIACRQAKLAVELDGGQHSEMVTQDAERTAYLKANGWIVMRIWNNELFSNTEAVAETILKRVEDITGISPYRHERRTEVED